MMQALVNQNFLPTDIIRLSDHKNLQSVTHYSTVNHSHQMEMSRTLSSVATGNPCNLSHPCNLTTRNSGVSVHSSTKIQKAISEHKVEKQHAMPALFSNATISGGSINMSINTLKQSPTLSTGCIKKMVIELWSALASSLYNLQKSFFHSRKDQAFSFRMSPFL